MPNDNLDNFCYFSPLKKKRSNYFDSISQKEKFVCTKVPKKKKIQKRNKFLLDSIKKSLNFDVYCKESFSEENPKKSNLKRIFFTTSKNFSLINKLR